MHRTFVINDKIRVASFLCTIMVLFRHSMNHVAFFNNTHGFGITGFIENTASVLTEIAVPYFFIVSGYFFFRDQYNTKEDFIVLFKKKWKGLVIPFIIWNIIGALILLLYDKEKVGSSFSTCLQNFLLSEWNGPLWYVREIIIYMFLAPCYYWLLRRLNNFLVILLWAVVYLHWWPLDGSVISSEGVFFFFIGFILRRNPYVLTYRIPPVFLVLFFLFWLLQSTCVIPFLHVEMHKINTLIGLVIFWQLLNFTPVSLFKKLYSLSFYSFFIYVMHPYLEKLLKKTASYFFYGNNLVALLTYVLVPIVTTLIILVIAHIWRRYAENSYRVVTGGR